MAPMPNIASVLKSEIARVARKELRAETETLKKLVHAHRSEIAALKRRAQALEQELRRLGRRAAKAAPAGEEEQPAKSTRYSAKSLASQRRRLALSAEDCGLLVGASGQSVYNWEAGKARPRDRHLVAIAALRRLGKKEASARLAALRAAK
jgi:DNA-binding transcriptional regulator YiaG